MSVTMTRTEGVTVLTLTSDPQSVLPPICQLFKSLCYSPVCCSVSQHLKKIQGTSQSALGAVQIMIGLLNIGLGAILCSSAGGSWWQMDESKFPYWFGGLFIFFGIMSILSEKYPSPCLIVLSAILNVVGVAFAIAAIVLYSINIAHIGLWWDCQDYNDDYSYEYRHRPRPSPSPQEIMMRQRCLEAKDMAKLILTGINAILIALSILHLCVTISSAVIGIKPLCCSKKGEESSDDLEKYKPLLEEVIGSPAA